MALPSVCDFFCIFRIFCHLFVISFCYIEKMVRSECFGLVKHIYLIQTIIFIRLLWLSGISKICVSFADKYIFASRNRQGRFIMLVRRMQFDCNSARTKISFSVSFHFCAPFVADLLLHCSKDLKEHLVFFPYGAEDIYTAAVLESMCQNGYLHRSRSRSSAKLVIYTAAGCQHKTVFTRQPFKSLFRYIHGCRVSI